MLRRPHKPKTIADDGTDVTPLQDLFKERPKRKPRRDTRHTPSAYFD
jgi:hypothetical protein